tara:strand:- start:672 stop:1037 length:366 start_codon:yes stop_codon:yes gene_type:complete
MLIKSLLVGLVLLVSTAATAQESKIQYLTTSNECLPKDQMRKELEGQYQETPILMGTGQVTASKNAEPYEGLMLLYTNIKTSTFTVIIYFEEDDVSCILITGDEMQPVVVKNSSPKGKLNL